MLCLTAWRPSETYTWEYVERLGFTAIADSRWPGWWCKMALFELGVPFLYADLDTLIVGEIPKPLGLTMHRGFYRNEIGQSGFMYVTANAAEHAWREWIRDPEGNMARFRGDGDFLRAVWGTTRFWQDDYPGKVVSFKVHCKGGVPEGAAVICYHGRPRPHETGWATHH